MERPANLSPEEEAVYDCDVPLGGILSSEGRPPEWSQSTQKVLFIKYSKSTQKSTQTSTQNSTRKSTQKSTQKGTQTSTPKSTQTSTQKSTQTSSHTKYSERVDLGWVSSPSEYFV